MFLFVKYNLLIKLGKKTPKRAIDVPKPHVLNKSKLERPPPDTLSFDAMTSRAKHSTAEIEVGGRIDPMSRFPDPSVARTSHFQIVSDWLRGVWGEGVGGEQARGPACRGICSHIMHLSCR